jgi:uncharacterized RDD family membrane protein YckC
MSEQYGGQWSGQPASGGQPPPAEGWGQPGQPAYGPPPSTPGPQPGYPPQPTYGPPPGYGSQPGYPVPAGYAAPGYLPALRTDYADWGKRVGAMLIDQAPYYIGMIIFFVGYTLWLISLAQSASSSLDFSVGGAPMLIGSVVMLAGFGWNIYNRWIVGGKTGQSLGKRVTNIRLIGEQTDAPIGPTNAFLRDLVHILDGIAYVGYLWPLWDDKKQTFADKIMNTVVVDAPPGA